MPACRRAPSEHGKLDAESHQQLRAGSLSAHFERRGEGRIVPIRNYDESLLAIQTPDVLDRIQRKDRSWEAMVPAAVAEMINAKNLFTT
jgi:hypothetical protein